MGILRQAQDEQKPIGDVTLQSSWSGPAAVTQCGLLGVMICSFIRIKMPHPASSQRRPDMTTPKPVSAPAPGAPEIVRFPDARPCDMDMTTYYYVNFPAYPSALADHLGNLDATVIISEMAAGLRATETYEGILFPDLLIALDANPAAAQARNGYLIPEPGQAPRLRAGSSFRDYLRARRRIQAECLRQHGSPRILAVRPHRRLLSNAADRGTCWRTGSTGPSPFTGRRKGITGATATC